MTSTHMARVFSRLQVGDLVSTATIKCIVLRACNNGLVLFGKICKCGNHVHGHEFAITWSDRKNAPTLANGEDVDWWQQETRIEVEKEFNIPLAKKYSHLACHDDFTSTQESCYSNEDERLIKKLLEVNFNSDADRRIVELQRLKLLGIHLTPYQEKILTAVLDAEVIHVREEIEEIGKLGEIIASVLVPNDKN